MRLLGLVLVMVSACASAKEDSAAKPTPTRELAVGGARIRGGGVRMDVQVGRRPTKLPLTGTGVTAKPAATVIP